MGVGVSVVHVIAQAQGMTQAGVRKHVYWKLKEHKRHWLLIWALTFGCWICYNSGKVPSWLQHGTLYGQAYQTGLDALGHQKPFQQPNNLQQIGGIERNGINSSSGNEDYDYDEFHELDTIDKDMDVEGNVSEPLKCMEGQCNHMFDRTKGDLDVSTTTEVSSKHVPKKCATVEEMGAAAAATTMESNLQVRKAIQDFFAEHGAQHVRTLPGEQFCRRGFMFGRAQEDGFGNEMYKVLTTAGLALMLNRSIIIGEDSSTNPAYLGLSGKVQLPFGDYIAYSNETFTMREVKHLWVIHDCAGKYKRPLNLRIDSIQRPSGTNSLCEDWTKWTHPIIWFTGAQDAVALQFFLKNMHPAMKSVATGLLGDPSRPSTRTNIFGELMRVLIRPMPVIKDAIQWTLMGGGDPDIALHLRMRHSRSRSAIDAACRCIQNILRPVMTQQKRVPRVVVVTDTPAVLSVIRRNLEASAEVIYFDYQLYLNTSENISAVMRENYFQPPRTRVRDWGPHPRWVALVDFFLASRARHAVVSGGTTRVATTYAQLVASLAAAYNLDEQQNRSFNFYSSFRSLLLLRGLSLQRGWGHAWRTFGGKLSCANQPEQCALTPLLPPAWWDGPWQSPGSRDVRIMRAFGIHLNASGHVVEKSLVSFCRSRRKPSISTMKLELPPCHKLKLC